MQRDVLDFFRAGSKTSSSPGHPQYVVVGVLSRCSSISSVDPEDRGLEKFKTTSISSRRLPSNVVNILKDFQGGSLDPALFEGPDERTLHDTFLPSGTGPAP